MVNRLKSICSNEILFNRNLKQLLVIKALYGVVYKLHNWKFFKVTIKQKSKTY